VLRIWSLEGGEKMNKKVSLIVLVLGLLMLFVAVAPVMAAPATKGAASTVALSTGIVPPPPEVKVTKSGIVHVRGINYINIRTLTIGLTFYDEVYAVGSYDVTWNPKTGTAICHFTAVWYVGSLTETTPNGFSGYTEIKIFNVEDPQTMEGATYTTSRSVMQGFGSFAQQTLKLGYEGPYPGMDTSGYCIIP
jgi:hypothetical protein